MKIGGVGNGNNAVSKIGKTGAAGSTKIGGVQAPRRTPKDSVTISSRAKNMMLNPQNGEVASHGMRNKVTQSYNQVQQAGNNNQVGNNMVNNNITINNKFTISMQNNDPGQKGLSLESKDLMSLIKELWEFYNNMQKQANGAAFILIQPNR